MIEVIYKEDKCKAQGNEQFFHIPKNIRQIGLISEEHKIYIEDYACLLYTSNTLWYLKGGMRGTLS